MSYINNTEANYIQSLLSHSDAYHREIGLEKLCSLYRAGLILVNTRPMLTLITGLIHDSNSKVKRWALNAYALLSKKQPSNVAPIIDAIQNNTGDPEVLCAGFAALFSVCGDENALKIIHQKKLSIEGPYLVAAAQYSQAMQEQAVKQRVDLDKACALELKNAAILIGMNRAPENLFHPNHSNKDVIGVLNKHDDKKVIQYSVWAIVENKAFGIADCGLDIKDIASFPENVRGWMYRLMVANGGTALLHRDYIEVGANDNNLEARLGLAAGLKNVFFSGMENEIQPWLSREQDGEVRALLYDHMASSSDQHPPYADAVKTRYKLCGAESFERTRLESAAVNTGLYRELKKISYEEHQGALFPASHVTNNITLENSQVGNLTASGVIAGTEITGGTKK